MKTIKIIDNLVGLSNSLDSDFLTEKELDKIEGFIYGMYSLEKHYPDTPKGSMLGKINGFKSYIEALKLKIIKRGEIPKWYSMNKI